MSTFDARAVAFPTLDESQIARIGLCTGAALKLYPKGQRLIEVGDRDFKLFLVKSGEVEIFDESGDTTQSVTIHHAGGFTGDISHLTGRAELPVE